MPYLISIEAFSYVTETSNNKKINILPDTYKRHKKGLWGRLFLSRNTFV